MSIPQPLRAQGFKGSVSFDGRFVTIHHTAFAPGGRSDRQFAVPQVSGVELKKAGLTSGAFTLVVAGAVAPRSGLMARRFDPLTVEFTWRRRNEFEHMRDAILQAVHWHHAAPPQVAYPTPPPAYPVPQPMYPPPPPTRSLADELTRLATLRDQGVLTSEEFEAAKQRLLGGSL